MPVPLNHLGTAPLLAPPVRGLLLEEEFSPSRGLSGTPAPPEEDPGCSLSSTVDELTRESPISGLELERTDNTLETRNEVYSVQ